MGAIASRLIFLNLQRLYIYVDHFLKEWPPHNPRDFMGNQSFIYTKIGVFSVLRPEDFSEDKNS